MASLFISMETTRYGLGSGSGSPVLPSLTWPGMVLVCVVVLAVTEHD